MNLNTLSLANNPQYWPRYVTIYQENNARQNIWDKVWQYREHVAEHIENSGNNLPLEILYDASNFFPTNNISLVLGKHLDLFKLLR